MNKLLSSLYYYFRLEEITPLANDIKSYRTYINRLSQITSWLSSAKHQRKITNSCVVWEQWFGTQMQPFGLLLFSSFCNFFLYVNNYFNSKWNSIQDSLACGRPSPPKIQECQINQQIQSWSKNQLQDSIANKRVAWLNCWRFSFPSWNNTL